MNEEVQRLKTYAKWPIKAPVTSESCAKAGFYSTGKGLQVQCHFCGIKIKKWKKGDNPLDKHTKMSPECPLIKDPSSSGNVPISGIIKLPEKPPDYLTLQARLQTFQKWKYADVVAPESLAEAGFYSLQVRDKVKCVYCNGVLLHWEAGDDPKAEHKFFFPKCNFVLADFKHENLDPLNMKLRTTYSQHHVTFLTMTGPCHPEYEDPDDRMRSFDNWPPDKTQTPKDMVDAGFFYSGSEDKVRCYYCNGTLKSWQPEDDAWEQHAKWFPHCRYVKDRKGQEFIKLQSGPPDIDLDPDPDTDREFSGTSKST